uniref:Helix-turn-helix domain-containing protein n=1 Tax=Pseudomonas sp. K-62 TaxID=76885 RepID=I2FG27_9PSED|nr:hypothetical protein [Pseudomonas sp. K-62]BAM13962.1 hypothetical protein [Pseudomonas sp. K-62]
MFADELRRAIEAADRITLPQVTALLWRAYGDGKVTEAEAEALSGLIEARTDAPAARPLPAGSRPSPEAEFPPTPQDGAGSVRRSVGSRPRTEASMQRRRHWAASGRLPPGLAARFTLAEQAVLALVAAETVRRKDCRLSIENMAAVAGVCRSTVKNAIREARQLGLLTVEERQLTGFRNDTNVVRVISREWQAWLRLARRETRGVEYGGALRGRQGGGVKSATTTTTEALESRITRAAKPWQGRPVAANPPTRATSRTTDA